MIPQTTPHLLGLKVLNPQTYKNFTTRIQKLKKLQEYTEFDS